MEFSKEFLKNSFFQNQAVGFHEPKPEEINGTFERTGTVLQPNGDYLFRIYAPGAREVKVFLGWNEGPLVLTKNEEGFFEGIYPYNPRLTGQVGVSVIVDGALFLSPYIPICWTMDRPCNYIEVPDEEMDFAMLHHVPHGALTREIYWAENLKTWQRCFVYTPPGYMNGDKEYPVLYLLHGGSDNEIAWEYGANMSQILDNLIAEKECEEFIVVMNNGMLRYEDRPENEVWKYSGIWDTALEDMLTGSCIPYIESHYRVKTGKWNRAIGGLSMGSYQTNDIGFGHPELFGYMGHFTAGMTHETIRTTYERPYKKVLGDKESFEKNYRVYYRSTTPNEDHLEFYEADDRLYQEAGIDRLPCYVRKLYPDGTSRWKSWRLGLRDYAKLIFK